MAFIGNGRKPPKKKKSIMKIEERIFTNYGFVTSFFTSCCCWASNRLKGSEEKSLSFKFKNQSERKIERKIRRREKKGRKENLLSSCQNHLCLSFSQTRLSLLCSILPCGLTTHLFFTDRFRLSSSIF